MRPTLRSAARALLPFALALAGAGCPGRSGEEQRAMVGRAAPGFRLAALGGGEVSLSDYQGRVVLLDFWATWCRPCHEQARILAPLYEVVRGRGVEFLAVDSGEEAKVVERFVARNPFPYPVLLDPQDTVSLALDVVALPTVVIVDKAGKVAYFREGIADAEVLRRELERAGA